MKWVKPKAPALTVIWALTLIAASALANDKNEKKEWQAGKLVSIEEGTPQEVGYVIRNQGSVVGGYSECRNWAYTVETDTMTYVFFAHTGAWCADHPRPFTVGNQVKFLLEPKSKARLLDEEGKEFKASVVKKTAKHSAQ